MEEGNIEINVYIVVVYSNFIIYLFFLNEKNHFQSNEKSTTEIREAVVS